MLARSFVDNGYDCTILDVLSDETATLYKALLAVLEPTLVLLLPTWEEILRRNEQRRFLLPRPRPSESTRSTSRNTESERRRRHFHDEPQDRGAVLTGRRPTSLRRMVGCSAVGLLTQASLPRQAQSHR